MAEFRAGSEDQIAFLQELLDVGLLIDSGVHGVYGQGKPFEQVRDGLNDLVTRISVDDEPERMTFPPVIPRRQLEHVGYLRNFPHLAGSIFSFDGDEKQAAEQADLASRHEDWSAFQTQTDLVLTPASCYPVYPVIGERSPLPAGGMVVDTGPGYVFRREPSSDPARMQMFHMRELVRIGSPDDVAAWRDAWRDKAIETLRGLGLDADFDVANDPFFGRGGRLLASNQRSQELKFELIVQIAGPEPTAVWSCNYHQEHFGEAYDITVANGGGEPETAHTACLGIGVERITLALFRTHGLDVAKWPENVREQLALA